MHQRPARSATLLLLVIHALSISNALAAVQVQTPAITLALPDGWVEIPQEVLALAGMELKRQAPNAPVPNYDYGFQKSRSGNVFEYPYVLVQINNGARVPAIGGCHGKDGFFSARTGIPPVLLRD